MHDVTDLFLLNQPGIKIPHVWQAAILNCLTAAKITITLLIFSSAAANTEELHCEPLKKINGVVLDSGASAFDHSLSKQYPASIAVKPGSDIGNAPSVLTKILRAQNVEADCFIDKYVSESGKTQFSFYVAGSVIKHNGQEVFEIVELQEDTNILLTVIAEAKTAQMLLPGKSFPD